MRFSYTSVLRPNRSFLVVKSCFHNVKPNVYEDNSDSFIKRLRHEVILSQAKKDNETKKLISEAEEYILNRARSGELEGCLNYYNNEVEYHFANKGLSVNTQSGRNETYMLISWNHLTINKS